MQEMQALSLGWEDPLEKKMATYSSIPVWEVPWTEEPDRLQFTGGKTVRHNLATKEQQPPPVDCRKKKKQKTMVNDFPGKQSPKDGIHHVLWNSEEANMTKE